MSVLVRSDRDWLELPPVQDQQHPLGTDFPEYQPRLPVTMASDDPAVVIPQLPVLPPPKEPVPSAVATVAAAEDKEAIDTKKKPTKKGADASNKKNKKAVADSSDDDDESSSESSDESEAPKSTSAPAPAPAPAADRSPAPAKRKAEQSDSEKDSGGSSDDSDADKYEKKDKKKKKNKNKKKEDKKNKKKSKKEDKKQKKKKKAKKEQQQKKKKKKDESSDDDDDSSTSSSLSSDSELKKKPKKKKKKKKKEEEEKKKKADSDGEDSGSDEEPKKPSGAPKQKAPRLSKRQREEKLRSEREQQRSLYKIDSPDGKHFEWHLKPNDARRLVTQRDIDEASWWLKPVKSVPISSGGGEAAAIDPDHVETMIGSPDDHIGVLELKKKDDPKNEAANRPKHTLFFVVMGRDKKGNEKPVRLKANLQKRLFRDVPYDFEIWGVKKVAWRQLRGRYIPALGEWSWEHRRNAALKRGKVVAAPADEQMPDAPAPPVPKSSGKRVLEDDAIEDPDDEEKPKKELEPAPAPVSNGKKLKRMSDVAKVKPEPVAAASAAPTESEPKRKTKQAKAAAKIVEELERINNQKVNPLTEAAPAPAPAPAPAVPPSPVEMVPECATREELRKHIRPADTAAARLFVQMVRDAYKKRPQQYAEIIRTRDHIIESINKAEPNKVSSALIGLFGQFAVHVSCLAVAQTLNIDELLRKHSKAPCASTAKHARPKSERQYEKIDSPGHNAANLLRNIIEISLAQSIFAIDHPAAGVKAYDPNQELNVAARGEMTHDAFTKRLDALVSTKPEPETTVGGTCRVGSVVYVVLALFLALYSVDVADLDAPASAKQEEESVF